MNKGILLVNLGSPDSPSVGDVRRYLNEFLMDKRVIDTPWPVRRFVVGMILVNRPRESAHAYQSIWTKEGSPLIVISHKVRSKLQERFKVPVELAMRYQNPSIAKALLKLRDQAVDDLLLIPLFPHYAMSSYETAVERVKEVARYAAPKMKVTVQPPYGDMPEYIAALVASAKDYLESGYDHLLFSFHGIPERHLKKSDPTRKHCLTVPNCCSVASPAHAFCYRHQCFRTAQEFTRLAKIPAGKWSVSFQSRLGKDPWLKPYTDFELEEFPKRGVKKIVVMSPAFVSDCLETVEELGIRGRQSFLQAGGTEFLLVPCLNEEPLWIGALEKMGRRFVAGGSPP